MIHIKSACYPCKEFVQKTKLPVPHLQTDYDMAK